MISPVVRCVYCQELLNKLCALVIGCHLPGSTFSPSPIFPGGGILCGTTFMGVTIYTEDILLLAPTREALQHMVRETELFASSHNIFFSTDPSLA